MLERQINSLGLWFFESLLKYDEIYHFVSTRRGGVSGPPYESLNLAFHGGDDPEKVLQNRKLLASRVGIPLTNFTMAKQIHDHNVTLVTEEIRGNGAIDPESAINATDAMVTNVPNICLMVLLADCVPILFFDPRKKVIGVAHAGWRGTVGLVAQNTVKLFRKEYASAPTDIMVGMGPSIGPCCYQVGSEVIAQVKNIFHIEEGYIHKGPSDGKSYFNLWAANKAQLVQVGIPEENIEIARICTYCHADMFFSQRHQKGKTGRFGAGIMIKNG